MRVLVTGSEGTLGRPLCRALEEAGHEVWTCDLMHSASPLHVRADVADFRQLERVFSSAGPHIVYHLAAEFGRNNGELYYEQVWRTNAIGTRNVLELCDAYRSKLAFASSSEVYGESGFSDFPNGHPEDFLREMHLDDQVPELTNEYAISKYTNELQVRNFVKRYGTPVSVLRFFNAYGPGELYHPYRSVVCLFVYRALKGEPWDVYEGYMRTFMHIDDFIPTLSRVAEMRTFPVGVFNVGGVDYRSTEELSDIVVNATGADPELARRVGKEEHNVVSKRPDIKRARKVLGHDPKIFLEHGVPGYVEWMREHM